MDDKTYERIDAQDAAADMAEDAATRTDEQRADGVIDNLDNFTCQLIAEAEASDNPRRGFGRVAGTIAEDRYSAGSTAARVAIYLMLTKGFDAAVDFARDMEHHER